MSSTKTTLVYHIVAKLGDVATGCPLRVQVQGRDIALFNVDGNIFATDNICTHEYSSLSDGVVEGEIVECPLHGAYFNVRTGKALSPPATTDLNVYPVRVEDSDVLVGFDT